VKRTGNTSLLSEEQLSNVDVLSLHTCTSPSKKFISQEELEWKGIVAIFFYQKMNVEQRL